LQNYHQSKTNEEQIFFGFQIAFQKKSTLDNQFPQPFENEQKLNAD
jgi:hypothetical protein